MHSVLNEKVGAFANIIDSIATASGAGAAKDVLDTIDSEIKYNRRKNLEDKGSVYLGGSISKYTNNNLIMSFPMLCDNTLPIDTLALISKANERNIVGMLELLFSSLSLKGYSGAELLKTVHTNINPDMAVDDFIDTMKKLSTNESVDYKLRAQISEALHEMNHELKYGQKSFPVNSFSENSLENYVVRNANSKSVSVLEDFVPKDPYSAKGPFPSAPKNYSETGTPVKNGADQLTDKQKLDIQDRNALKQKSFEKTYTLPEKRLTAQEIKKNNELEPTLMVVSFNDLAQSGTTIVKTFVAGVKSRIISVDSMDIIERLVSKNKTSLSFKNLIRATTGEINFVSDFLLALKQNKLDAKNAAKKGEAARLWNILQSRAVKAGGRAASRDKNDASAITGLVINIETVNYMKNSYRFDITEKKNLKLIMDAYNLMSVIIADEANESIMSYYDGNAGFEEISYNSLRKEGNEKNTEKKIINLLNNTRR